jgi:hypothetical protein
MITSAHKDAIKDITQRILETFGKEYLRAFKYVAIRDAKKLRKKRDQQPEEDSSIEVEGRKYPGSTPEHPLRPRNNKNRKEVEMELKVKITSWTTFDDDIDPYVAFIVEASLGELSSSVYRRFTHFRSLHKMAKKKHKDLKKQFPNAKTFEGRKFDSDYLYERKAKLQSYLELLLKKGDYAKDPGFLKWLGLCPPEDPKFQEIFDIAYQNTKWRLWVWKRIPYDNEEEAIAKLAIEEIKREVIMDIVSPFPTAISIRSTAAATVYKGISATVGPLVAAGWKLAQEGVKPLKPKVAEIVDGAIDKYLDVEDMVKGKLIEGINKGLEPIIEVLEPILKSLSERFMDVGFSVVKEIFPYSQDLFKLFEDIVNKGDEKLVDEIEKLVSAKRAEAEGKVNDLLQKALENIIGDLSANITIDALGSLFSPIKKIVDLINTSFDVFLNPVPHVYCIKVLVEYRAKLEALDPKEKDFKERVEDILDQEESYLLWRRYWTYWDYRWKAWSIYYFSYSMPELSPISKILQKNAFKFAVIHKKWIKRWSFRFGDHLHERAKKATSNSWKEDIRISFSNGYNEANQFFKNKVGEILHKMVIDFFFSAIGLKVEATVMKALEVVLEPIQKEIPSPIDEILDLDTLCRECINASLRQNIVRLVESSIIQPYVNAWNEFHF